MFKVIQITAYQYTCDVCEIEHIIDINSSDRMPPGWTFPKITSKDNVGFIRKLLGGRLDLCLDCTVKRLQHDLPQ